MEHQPRSPAPTTLDELQAAYEELSTAEEELRRQTEELEQAHIETKRQRERYRQLFDEAPDGYILTDRFGIIRELNHAALEIVGRDRERVLGKPIFVMFNVDQRMAPRQALNNVLSRPRQLAFTAFLHSADDQPRLFEIRLVLVNQSWFDDRDDVSIRWIFRDLATLQRAAEAEREAEILRRSNRAKDELLGLVSHELRTPLTIVLGASRALSRPPLADDAASRAELMRDIVQSAERLRDIVDNMLALARAEREGELALEPVLLQRLLPAALERQPEFRAVSAFDVQLEPDLPPVLAASVFVDQVLQNLISNAIKYGDTSSPIGITAHAEPEMVAVTISNAGAPVEIDFARLFEPFYRSEATAARVSGAGLGLSACRRLLAAQGGTIDANARSGGGLDVTFRLRICDTEDYATTGSQALTGAV